MSGLEVVGIVLGSIPLVISALEHYADGVTTVRNMCEYEHVFLTSQSRLVLSIATFRQSCRELLQDLPDDRIRELVDLREGWDNEEVKTILRRRLGEDYAIYRVFVRQLNKRIDLLCRKLKLRDDLSVPFLVDGELDEKLRKDFFKKSWSRIRGGFNSEKHQQLVAEIKSDIDQLCAFTKGAVDLEMSECQKPTTAHSRYWLSLRSHSHRLCDTLCSFWEQTCPSRLHTHKANLRLDMPLRDAEQKDTPEFHISFRLGSCSGQPLPEMWRHAIISPLEAPPQKSPPSSSHPNQDKKKARFVVPILKIDPAYDQNKRCSPLTKIDCLCSALGNHCHIQRYCLGFIPGGDWHYHLHNTTPPSEVRGLVPLHDILDRKKQRTMTTRQKRTLAFALAAGILQTYDTAWLETSLSSSVVNVDPQSHTLHVIKEFAHQGPAACSSRPQADVCVKNHALFFLTIALLELTYGAPLTSHRTPADLDDAYTPYRIAERLTRQIQDDELPKFASVVGKCMYPTPEGTDFSLQNEAVRKRFWNEVIMPLREDWEELVTDPQHVFQDISG